MRPSGQDRLQRLHRIRQGPQILHPEFTKTAGLRACDKAHPCREDYICTAGYDDLPQAKPGEGTCIPPYFIFQFRVDGHPRSWVQDVRE